MRDPIVIALNEVRRHDIATVDGKEVCCSCGAVVPYGKHDDHRIAEAVKAAREVIDRDWEKAMDRAVCPACDVYREYCRKHRSRS